MKIVILIFLTICVFSNSFVFAIKKQESVNEKAISILWDLEAKWVYWVDKAVEKGENAIRLDTHSLWTFFEKYANFRALNIETGPIKVFNGIMDKTMKMMLEAVGDKTPYTGPDVMLDKNFDIIAKISHQRMFDAMKGPRFETVWNHFTGLKNIAGRMSDILGQCNYFNNDESDYRELLERATKVFNEFIATNKENFATNRAMNDAFRKVVNEMQKLTDKLKRKEGTLEALCNFHGMEVARLATEVQKVRIEEIYGLKNVLKVKVEPYDPESFNVQKVTALINGKPFMECEQIVDFCAIPFQQNYKAKEVAFKVEYTMVDNGDKDETTITIEEPIVLDRLEFVILDIDYQTSQLVNNGKAKVFTNNDSNVWFGEIVVHSDEKQLQGQKQNGISAEFEMSSQVRFDVQSQPFLQFNIQIQQKSVPGRGAHKEIYRFHLCDIGDEACENRIRGGQDVKYYEMEVEGKAANRIRRNAILKASFSLDANGQIVETDLNGNAKKIAEDATKLVNMQEEGNEMKICFAQGTKDIKLWCWKVRIVQTDKTLLLDPSKFVEELELEEIETVPSFADSPANGEEAHCQVDQMESQPQNHHHGQIVPASQGHRNYQQSQQQRNSLAIQSATNSETIACTTRSRNDAQPSSANLALTSQMSEYDSAIETMTNTIRLIEQSPNGYSLFIVTVQTDDLAILAMARTIFRHVEDSLVQRKLAHVQFAPVKEFSDAKLKYEYLKECIIVLQRHFNAIMEVLNNDQTYQSDRHFQDLLDTLNKTMLTSINYIAKRMLALYQASIGLKQQSGPALMAEMRTEATQSNRQQIGGGTNSKKNQQKSGESAAQQLTAVIKSADHSFSANIVAKVTEQTRRTSTLVLLSLLISIERKPVKDPNYQGTYFQIHFCPAHDTGCQNDLENNKNFHFLMDEQDVQIKLEPGKDSVLGKDMLALTKLNVPGWDRGQPFQMCIMDGTELMRKQANRIRVFTWDWEQMPRLCWTAHINFDKRQIHGHRRQRRSIDPIDSIVFTPAGAKNGSNVLKNTTGIREKKRIFSQPMTYLNVLEGIKNVDDAKLSALNKKATKTMGMVATMAEMGKVPEKFDAVYGKVVEHFAGQKSAAELNSFASRIIENSPETLEKIATKNKEAFGKLIDGSKGAAEMLAEYEIGNVLRNGQEAIGTVAKEIFAKVGTSMPQIGDKLQLVSQFVPELTNIVPNVSAYLENAANLKANALESVGNLKANALESVGNLKANILKNPIVEIGGSVSSGIGSGSAAFGRIASSTFGTASAGFSRAKGLWASSKSENSVDESSNPVIHAKEQQTGGFGGSKLVHHHHQQFQAINEEKAEENSEQNIGDVGLKPAHNPPARKPASEFGSKGIRRRTQQL